MLIYDYFLIQENTQSFIVKGIKFYNGPIEEKELCFAWRNFSTYLRLSLVAGSPAKIALVDWPEVNYFSVQKYADLLYLVVDI